MQSEAWTALLAAVLALMVLYRLAFRNLNYFKARGVPFVPAVPLLGNMAPSLFRRRTFAETISLAYNHNPEARYVGFFDFTSPVVILRDPELVKSVTIKNFEHFPDHKMLSDEINDQLFRENLFGLKGQRWRDMRALLSPTFTSSKMKVLFGLVRECSANSVRHMSDRARDGVSEFEMRDFVRRYTNDVIVTSAFGISVDSLKNPGNDFFRMGVEAVDFSGARSLKLFLIRTFPRLSKLLDVRLFSSRISNFYKNTVKATVAAREAGGIFRPDMIQLMMQARNSNRNLGLTDDEMTAHAFIFYFGGFDTVSLLISFVVHRLANSPEALGKLRAEVDLVVEQCGGDVTYEALHGMSYLDAVMNEVLRLDSPATITDRLCTERFELPPAEPGLRPFVVEPGVSVWIPVSAIHRDPKYFEDPDEFLPDRFLPEKKDRLVPENFIPFGSGPRFCIGNRFALMTAKILVFELMANFDMSPCGKTVNPLRLSPSSFVLSIDCGVWLKIEPRRSSPV